MNLFDVFGRKVPTVIAKLFLENPGSEMQVKNIINRTKLAKLSVMNWTKKLEKSGLLSSSAVGRARIYRLNRGSVVVKQMQILYNMDYIANKMQKVNHEAQIFVYGSFARGENTEKSDIDILVIDTDRSVIKRLKSIDNRVKVSFFTPMEWSMTARKDKAFFDSVEKDKIRIK